MTESDIENEASRILAAVQERGTDVRFLGGLAVARRCPSARRHPRLKRTYADIDLVARPEQRKHVTRLLEDLGYEPDKSFNDLHGSSRLLFWDVPRDRQIDVFLGIFRMCHTLDLRDRFFDGYDSLPLADIVLTKLQIIELNEKDARDVLAVFLDHDLGVQEEPDLIDVAYLCRVCSVDWGFYTTLTDNLEKLRATSQSVLDEADHAIVAERIVRLESELARAPKTLKWRMRSRMGRRVAWYDLPEEVGDASSEAVAREP